VTDFDGDGNPTSAYDDEIHHDAAHCNSVNEYVWVSAGKSIRLTKNFMDGVDVINLTLRRQLRMIQVRVERSKIMASSFLNLIFCMHPCMQFTSRNPEWLANSMVKTTGKA